MNTSDAVASTAPRCHPIGAAYHNHSPRHYHHHCFYCGLKLCDNPKHNRGIKMKPKYRTMDHVDPKSDGNQRKGNTVPACGNCNRRKSSLTLEEWRIVHFGGHGGEFYGERISRLLLQGQVPLELAATS